MTYQADKKVEQNLSYAKKIAESRRQLRIVKHEDPPPRVVAKRKKLEARKPDWLMHFGAEAFCDAWSGDHLKAIAKLETAVNHGGQFALAMPRGHGKSTIVKWAALYTLLTGRRKYVMVVAATSELARGIVEFMRRQLEENDRLHEYYPHVTTYCRATEGKAIKAKFQLRADGQPSHLRWSKDSLAFPEVVDAKGKDYPSNGAVIEAHGLTGAIRGKWRDTKSGRVIRPDFAILDDPQDRESAESETQSDMRERIITGDILGLAGPRKRIAAVMPCTVIRRGDLADRFLDNKLHPEWQGETSSLVYKWPDAQDTLWAEYASIFKGNPEEGGGPKAATQFYSMNREAMDAGAVVSWESRIRDGELSAIQTAENLMLELGPQFWAEYQNKPKTSSITQYEVTSDLICTRLSNFPRLTAPPGADIIVAAVDCNYIGLNFVVNACRKDAATYTVAWGKFPEGRALIDKERKSGLTEPQAIAGAIVELANKLNGLKVEVGGVARYIDCMGVDCGFLTDTIITTCQSIRLPMRVIPVRGFSSKSFRPMKNAVRRGDGWHVSDWAQGRVMSINVDYWREQMQRSFLLPPGVSGSIGLYGSNAGEHKPLADEIASEILVEKVETSIGQYYNWHRKPGVPNDKGDAMTYAYALASAAGASLANMEAAWRSSRPEPQVAGSVVITSPDPARPRPVGPVVDPRRGRQPSRRPSVQMDDV